MKIVTNDKLIKRNKKIGQILTGASLVILAGGLIISFRYPELVLVSWGALIFGFLLSQIGIYFGNRWGRSPRPDEILSSSLKGLDDRFTLCHYASPVHHLLVGPSALWVLLPYAQKGKISIVRNHYKQSGGNFILKFFGQEGLGRPEIEAADQVKDLTNALRRVLPDGDLPAVHPLIIFTSEEVALDVEDAPLPTTSAKKMKEVIRKRIKENTIPPEQLEKIEAALVKDVS